MYILDYRFFKLHTIFSVGLAPLAEARSPQEPALETIDLGSTACSPFLASPNSLFSGQLSDSGGTQRTLDTGMDYRYPWFLKVLPLGRTGFLLPSRYA